MTVSVVALLIGIAILAWASDQFVIGAARVAVIRRVPPLVIGAVIIGFGTSSPELLVSSLAAQGNRPEIAVGNIVGSNLANLALVLGVAALILPLVVDSRTVRREAPITVAAMALFAVLVQNGITLFEGSILVLAMVAAVLILLRRDDRDPLGEEAVDLAGTDHRLSTESIRTTLGLIGTVGGAQLLLWGAVDLAERAGIPEAFVGATLVAVGTSLPELVTVIQSARRRETDLIIGNLLGSNLFNALMVGGATGLLGSGTLDAPELTVAALAGIGLGIVVTLMMITGRSISRIEGAALVAVYAAMVPLLA